MPTLPIIACPECMKTVSKATRHAGKVCKLQKKIGQELTKTIGADAFSIDISKNLLDIPQEIASSLLPGNHLHNILTSASLLKYASNNSIACLGYGNSSLYAVDATLEGDTIALVHTLYLSSQS